MKTLLLLYFCISVNGVAFSQVKSCDYNIEIKLNGQHVIALDSIRHYTIEFEIENNSDKIFIISKDEIPNYENNDYDRINFVFLYDPDETIENYYEPIHLAPRDVQDVRNPIDDTRYILLPNQSYTFRFDLFRFYILSRKGNYKISAFYRIPLEDGGYYLKYSDNCLTVKVE